MLKEGTTRKVIAFDADDTLWHNEPYFRAMEQEFCDLVISHLPAKDAAKAVYDMQISNLKYYGYGVKSMVLSMIECAIKITSGKISHDKIERMIQMGQELLDKPVELIEDVAFVLEQLQQNYRLVLATKGDLLDQQRKLKNSNLEKYFHHIEVMSDKTENDYRRVIDHLDIDTSDFVMVGNSPKSDILPVLALGGHAFHVPYLTTWEHEKVDYVMEHDQLITVKKIKDVLEYL